MKLVQAHFSARMERDSSFPHRGSAVKHVQAWLCAKKDGESSFHYCGGGLKLV